MQVRIQKILSDMGIASRRKAEEFILEGRITVNGEPAILGTKADPEVDHIKLDGKLLTEKHTTKVYIAMHKPKSVVSTLSDPEGRMTVADLLSRVKARVYPIGRLDYDSEGLILLTNDGDFAHTVMHPSRKIPKTYHVKIKGFLTDEEIEKLSRGIYLEEGRTAPAKIKKMRKAEENSWVEIILTEGRKRQIRRMLYRVGHPVIKLVRIKVGPVELGHLAPGEYRFLAHEEVQAIRAMAGTESDNDKRRSKDKR